MPKEFSIIANHKQVTSLTVSLQIDNSKCFNKSFPIEMSHITIVYKTFVYRRIVN